MRLIGVRFKVLLAAICALAVLPASAQAVTIDGDKLDIHLGAQGNIQVLALGQNSYSFYPQDETFGDAGFFIGSAGTTYGPPLAAGENDVNYTAGTQGAVTGSGTSGSPFQQVTTYEADSVAEVTQTTTYVKGERAFRQSFALSNTSGGTLSYRASTAADLYLEGSDSGIGFFSPGPPKFVGGLSEATGRAGGLREVAGSPWSAYQEGYYDDIWANIFDAGLDSSIVASSVDNGIGVQWNGGLGSGGTATYEVEWQFGLGGLTVSPPSARLGTGSFHEVTLTATDANGGLVSGGTIRYEISGANPESGSEKTGGNGKARVGWVGDEAGTDTLSAYLDEDGDKKKDPTEPETSANAVFVDPETNVLPPPPLPNMPPLQLQGKPILQNGTTTLVLVVPSAGRLTVQQANGGNKGGGNKGGKKSSAGISANAVLSAAKGRKGAKGGRGKARRGKGKGKRRRPRLVRRVVKRPKQAGPVRVRIRPTKLGKKVLNKRGKFTVKLRISFTPAGTKATQAVTRKVTLKKKAGKGKGGKKGGRAKGKGKRGR